MSDAPKPQPAALAIASEDFASARAQRERRVDHIVHLMANGWWNGARTTVNLAAEWAVSKHAVSEYAREASGIIRHLIDGDPEAIRAEILSGIEHVRLLALESVEVVRVGKDEYVERRAPKVDAALRAYELRARMLGLLVEKHEISGDLKGLTDAELDARLAAAIARARCGA